MRKVETMEEYVLLCEDSIEGILTGIYEAYQLKKDRELTSIDCIHLAVQEPFTHGLFTRYESVKEDRDKAARVSSTLKRELGEEAYYKLCLAMISNGEDKADAVFHTVVLGLKNHDRNIFARLQEEAVSKAFSYTRGTNNEILHLKGFLRFQELESKILYAKIGPKNNILPFLMPHFSDRLPAENFVIYDDTRGFFGLHPQFKQWYLVSGQAFDEGQLVFSQEEQVYQELFVHFCKSVAVEARTNPNLQMNMLPLRFRPYMVEFEKRSK